MNFELSPTEEHYLKRELIKQELQREIDALNDAHALRKFGYPFATGDPRVGRSRRKMIPNLKSSKMKKDNSLDSADAQDTDFPLLSHFLQHFVMTVPLFSQNMVEKEDFWQQKVQVFFEHFMQMKFSSSFDREELTKRRRMGMKLSKIILLVYNSGIASAQEPQYFAQDKFKLEANNIENYKSNKLDEFVMPTKDSLKLLLTEEPYFINGWDFNVMAAFDYSKLQTETEVTAKSPTSPSSVTGGWMKSALTFSPVSFSYPAKLFSKMTLSDSSHGKSYQFVTRVRSKESGESWFVTKTYSDFKNLASDLGKEFPGKELPKLPHRSKVGVSTTTVVSNSAKDGSEAGPTTPKERIASSFETDSPVPNDSASVSDSVQSSHEEEDFEDAHDTITQHLPRERMRTSLRKFLRTLVEDSEVSKSISMSKFVNTAKVMKDDLPPAVVQDMKRREAVDVENLHNQVLFQKLAFEHTLELQKAMKEFKASLLKDENYLVNLFAEIKEKTCVSNLSPTLQSFMAWCRVNMSATIYTTFLGGDGGHELFTQIKRLHRLMPYTVMVQILKITNPMAIMKGMMDLFMARPFGGNSLLQNMFSSVLSDDLKSQFKLARELEAAITGESRFGSEVVKVLAMAIFENEDSQFVDMDSVHGDATSMSMPIPVVLLMKCSDMGHLSQDALGELIESYSLWKGRKNAEELELSRIDSSTSIADVPGLYFSHVKGLLQIYIRERDKKLMKQVWQDPELSQLLKSMVTILYEPLVRIFRVSRMDVAFRSFERFMDDLVKLLDEVFNGQSASATTFNIVDAISKVVEKHEDALFQFIHDICINDSENTFEGMIKYLTSIVKFLQKSKYDKTNRVDLTILAKEAAQRGIDVKSISDQVKELVANKTACRQIYQKIVETRVSKTATKKLNVKETMEQKWQQSNKAALPDAVTDIGFEDGELVDLDLDVGDFSFLLDSQEETLQREYQDMLEKIVDVSEISKMADSTFKDYLRENLTT
ncbi:LADA_0C03334g1_1 [Lachancea dasiensis]|uniref:LADA_0C03334g1_1 n=1 Tax=Lachancea dasiensis TaxID=1072105 RepID=A0A1G4IY94_9SACH|nr:LADA_0C03334g1_1 [Lachancea dasiensis]